MSKTWDRSKISVPGALIICIAAVAVGLVACSDNSATSTKLTINGTAATGAPMANAKVTVLCASDKFPGQIKQGIDYGN
jgi:hypothetical protein